MGNKHKFPRGEDRPFFITLENSVFKKGEIIFSGQSSTPLLVIKQYRSTKLKRFLIKLGFSIRVNQIKVKKQN